jgi:hypothetical protein
MAVREIVDTAVLIGTSPDGACVYSALVPLHDYWDGGHPWDSGEMVKSLRLVLLRGYLFGSDGQLLQHFESRFNLDSGIFVSGWAVHEDGTRTES